MGLLRVGLCKLEPLRKFGEQSIEQLDGIRVATGIGKVASLNTQILRLVSGTTATLEMGVEVLSICVAPSGATKPLGLAHGNGFEGANL
jgi:hypothetical protein